MKADIAREIDITNTFEQTVISENGKKSMFSKVVENSVKESRGQPKSGALKQATCKGNF